MLKKLSVVEIFFIIVIGWYIFNLPCVVFALTGRQCPTCGMTRAMVSLGHGDICGYMSCNPFAFPMLLVIVAMLANSAFLRKKYGILGCILVLLTNFVWYVLK